MKTGTVPLIKKTLLTLALVCLYAGVQAQRLSDIQNTNVWAPPRVKIDGKLTEWEYPLKAFNSNTKLFYTMANDNNNLYLAIKSSDAQNIIKIMAGGITLNINPSDKKKDKNQFSITFPVITRATRRAMRGNGGGFGRGGGFGGGAPAAPDSATIAATHKNQIAALKEIAVSGFKDITDSTISIYNEYGIMAAINYDSNNALIIEMAIPLSLLNMQPDKPKEFAYNIIVNGMQSNNNNRNNGDGGFGGGNGGSFGGDGGGGFGGGGFGGGGGGFGGGGRNGGGGGGRNGSGGGRVNNIDFADLQTPTDFWGKYTLAKVTATTSPTK